MLIEQGTNNGFHPSTIVGKVTAEPIFNVTPKGKHHVVFYVQYGNQKDENGKYVARSILCEAWDFWADICNQFEKGDNVAVFAVKQQDEYRSKKNGQKTYKAVVEFALNAGALYADTDVNNEEEDGIEDPSGFFA